MRSREKYAAGLGSTSSFASVTTATTLLPTAGLAKWRVVMMTSFSALWVTTGLSGSWEPCLICLHYKRNQENGSNSGNFSFSTANMGLKSHIGTGFRVHALGGCRLKGHAEEVELVVGGNAACARALGGGCG